MWPKLIELLLKWWQDKPRRDLVHEIIDLRDAMHDCQRWYEIYKLGSAHEGYPDARRQWLLSLRSIGRAVEKMDEVISIYSPDTKETLRIYLHGDLLLAGAEGFINLTSKALGTNDTGVNVNGTELSASFSLARDTLDHFVRTTFKPEEILAARRHRPVRYKAPPGL